MTTWKNACYRLRLIDGDAGAVLVLRNRETERAVFCRVYAWHERRVARNDAEALVALGGLEQVGNTDMEGMFA